MNFKAAYFLGVGGAGMSSIARYLKREGLVVKGYDKTATKLTRELEQEGIDVNLCDSVEQIPEDILSLTTEELLIVITPAIPEDNIQLKYLKSLGHVPIKRAALLGEIIKCTKSIAISGTHGKTSTTAILAHILDGTDSGCNAFLGGISAANNSNLYLSPNAEWTVVEADEFDRSFHHLHPTLGLVTSIDPDHLDVYGSVESFEEGFKIFTSQISEKVLIASSVDKEKIDGETYGTTEECDHFAYNIEHLADGVKCSISINKGEEVIEDVRLLLFGLHNLENSVGASVLAYYAGVKSDTIKTQLESFPGIYRRFQIHVNTSKRVYIDDYAHHPTEISKTIEATREHFPGRHLTVIFQPHLYSRTQDQLSGFAQELNKADRVILLPIYPARELPIPGVNTQLILNNMSNPHAEMSTKNSIFENLKAYSMDVVLSLGAGDIDTLVPAIKEFTALDA